MLRPLTLAALVLLVRARSCRVDETDLGFLYPPRAADGRDDVLVEDNAIYELGILDCAANLLHYSDVAKVDI